MKKFILFFCAAFIATLGMFADTVTLTYTAGVTSNLTGENDAATLGVNDAEWSIVSDKNGNNNHVGINKDGTIRLYANNILTITNLKGKVITSVVLDVAKNEGAVRVDGVDVEGVDNVYEIGAGEFVLTNPNSAQWQLNSITINYETPGNPLVCSDVVDGGVYAIVNFQSTGAMYYLENVDGVLTAQNGEGIDGDTQWAATAQYKAIELEDGRFAFQNVATGDYLAWRSHQANGGIDGNRGFYGEINECTSWTMMDGTKFPEYRTYYFYAGNRSDSNANKGSLILDNSGAFNACNETEWDSQGKPGFSNNFGFVAVPTEVDFTKVNISAINQVDFVEAGKWYLLKQKRGGVSPVYDAGEGATMKRAANDNAVVAGMDAAEAVDYLLSFIPTENEGAYNLQFANGRYWANTMTTSSEEVGEYNVYNINGEAGHIGINLFDMENIVDNNGAGNTLAFWASGEVQELNGNNDWTVWEVEFAAKTTAAADLKALIAELEEAYAANNVAELGDNLITETSQFSSPYTEPSEGDINNLLDGDCKTFWHSAWSQGEAEMHVHYLQVDLPEAVSGDIQVTLGRRSNGGNFCDNDNVVLLGVEASVDGENYVEVGQIEMPMDNAWYHSGVVTVEGVKSFRFFNDESNGTKQRGYWHAGEFQLNQFLAPSLNAQYPEAAAALLEAIAAAKACGANATEADIATLQAAYATYEAALGATPEPTPVTFEFTDNEDGTITITPSDPEAFYFFNIYSDRINTEYQLGTDAEAIAADVAYNLTAPEVEAHTGVSVVDPAEWLQYWFGGYVQYTAGDYRLGVVELSYNGTYAMAGEPVFHAFTKAADQPVVDVRYALSFDKDMQEKEDDRHVTSVSLDDQVADFGAFHTVYLDATEYTFTVEAGAEVKPSMNYEGVWMHGLVYLDYGQDGSFYEEGDLVSHTALTGNPGSDFATSFNSFVAPTVPGTYRMRYKTDWVGGAEAGLDPAGRIGDDGTNTGENSIWKNRGRIIDVTLVVVGEETFPAAGVAYKIKNVNADLYVGLIDHAEQNVVLQANPDKIYFNEVEGGYTISNEAGYVMGRQKVFEQFPNANGWKWNIANSDEPLVWEIVELEDGHYALKGDQGHLGFDTINEGSKGFRDKNYAEKNGILTILKFDEEEEQPEIPDASLEEIWEAGKALLAEAKQILELNQVTIKYDRDGYFEDIESPIVGKVGYKTHDVVYGVADAAKNLEDTYSWFPTIEEMKAYFDDMEWPFEFLIEPLQNVIADYNEAEVVLPEAGKTYIIRNQPFTYSDEYSYAFYLDGQNLSTTQCVNATEAKHMWTCAGSSTYTYFNADLDAVSDVRYQFYNAEDNSQYFAWKRVDTDATKADTKWYLTGKNLDGTASPVYGTIAMHTYADNNQYRLLVIDMRNGAQQHANGHCWGNTYSDWYWFEEVEIPVTEWDGAEPAVAVVDEATVTVTFNEASKVEASNYGVLAAIFDESGDVVSVVFDALLPESVEFGKDCATLHFQKVADLNASFAASAKSVAAKALAAVGGEAKGKLVILGKSFKIDDATLYQAPIICDFSFGGTQTGIDAATLAGENNVFDLAGRRVREAKNGLFLLDGKKVVK